ncbi:nuclear transport factor 2 family protein [Glutamicibacter protophormiae]|uniref:nuclear transport factor 2 family protein n=1 Tax=Glutamicibacter protophormiae TaxID=37930 RepID=UPI003BB108B4
MDMEQRLAALEAIEEIKALKHRYWRACDGKDPQGFRDCFIQRGAVIDYGPMGAFDDVEPMAEIFTQVALAKVDGKHVIFDMHHGMHPDITLLSPTTARGRWTLRFRQVNLLEGTEYLKTGEYDDEYVLVDGQWKMSACRFTDTWSMTRALDESAQITEGEFMAVPAP